MTFKPLLLSLALAPCIPCANIGFSFGSGGSISFPGGNGSTATLTGSPIISFNGGAFPAVPCFGGCVFQITTGPLTSFTTFGSGGLWSFAAGGTFTATAPGAAFLDLNPNGIFDSGIDANGSLGVGTLGAFTLASIDGHNFSTTQIPLAPGTFSALVDAYFGDAPATAFTGTVNIPFTGSISNPSTGAFSNGAAAAGNAAFDALSVPEPSTLTLAAAAFAAAALIRRRRSNA
jgi:MYXO-CTERM domain-containing protein